MNCRGLHCGGCSNHGGNGGRGGLAVAGLVVLVLIAAGARAAAHVLSELLTILIITAASVAGLALTTGAVAAVVAYRRRELARRAAIAPVARVDAPAIVRVLGPRELPDGRRDEPASLRPAAPSYALRDRNRARWSR